MGKVESLWWIKVEDIFQELKAKGSHKTLIG
jgi:hypothetical protein